MAFQIHALTAKQFNPLFTLTDSELKKIRATRMIADATPGYPCRVSLADAEVGDTVILVNFLHQPADSPFQASHAIFVRENAQQACPDVGEVPEFLATRLISIRAFDDRDYIVNATAIDGNWLCESIRAKFEDSRVAYLHLHNAKMGCYLARVTRA